MNFNLLARRILLGLFSLVLACPAEAAFLPWQVGPSSIQAADQNSVLTKDEPAEQGTSSSSNGSSASPAQAQPSGDSERESERKQKGRVKGTSFKRMFLNIPGDQK